MATGMLLVATNEAHAQDASSEGVALEEITVTGSRLGRSELESPAPIAVVGADDIARRGPVTLDTVLNDYPQLKPDNKLTQNFEGGSGVLKANLRGLGAARTLVLVNGRRYTPADATGAVDLATIPQSLVERVEILTGGASAVYGSDAVAGAINFILRDSFDGLELNTSFGQTFRGDGETKTASMLLGTNFAEDRGNVVVSVDWYDSGTIFFNDREFSAYPVSDNAARTDLVFAGSTTLPGGLVLNSNVPFTGVAPASCTQDSTVVGVRFGENGVPQQHCSPSDNFDTIAAGGVRLLRPLERWQISGLAQYELTEGIDAFTELFYVNSENNQQISPTGGNLALSLSNYATNPVIAPAARDFLVANSAIFDPQSTGTATLTLRRRSLETGFRASDYERDSFSLTGGLRGDLDLLGDEPWKWETYYSFQKSSTSEFTDGNISLQRLAMATDVVVTNGVASCRQTLISGCVPVSLFGVSSLTPEMARWLTISYVNDSHFERQVLGASLSGRLFDLPGGALSLAVGAEYRDESYEFRPSPPAYNGELSISTGPPTGGAIKVKEAFLETRIPVLTMLGIEGGVRVSDYSTEGIGAVTTYKLGGDFRPARWIMFRGMYNRAIRAPNLNELFAPSSARGLSVSDPCNAALSPSAEVRALCVAQGIPAAQIDSFAQLQNFALTLTGGNPDLDVEEATTKTAGIVLRPFESALNIAADYWDVKVESAIAAIAGQQFLNACFRTLTIDSVYCRAVTRDANGQLFSIAANVNNIAERRVTGIDLAVDYTLDVPWLALGTNTSQVRFSLHGTRQLKDETVAFAGEPTVDCVGAYLLPCSGIGISMTPQTRLLAGASWTSGRVTADLRATWIDSFEPLPGVPAAVDRIPSVTYVDLNTGYQFGDSLEVSIGVQNVFDKQPTVVGFRVAGDPNVDPSLYDVLGRRFFVGFSAKL